ncbi:hypothetical protein BU23DRAFT_550388 [Bimuria novae-zelandiae CBS 107.79]|uniref:Uncharacterized protein n=1 Tax=Bimuria novae-zelandiae CBS 107.79 TaxID=1447943 RepID=A0A6A5VML3_9PLEO|nr:hypothetical protein BU23DRAFT_550388 [Bimuria novae-zelandiae CBS 107.79]
MTTTTCYDNGWCDTVPIPQETGLLDAVVSTGGPGPILSDSSEFFLLPTTSMRVFKPTTTTRKSRTHTEDGKPQQTNEINVPEPTPEGQPGRSSTNHSSSTAPTAILTDSASQTSGEVIETVSPGAAAAANNASGGSGRVSKGAVAGIAIATAVVGGAIAFIIAFLVFKRRSRVSGHGHSDSSTTFITTMKGEHPSYVQVSQTGPPPIVAAAIPTSKRSSDLSDLSHSSDFLAGVLPPGADEQTVRNRATALFSQIQQHVYDFYRDVHATLTPTMEADLRKFSGESVNLAEELEHSSMPTIAIKHALMLYVLGIVSPEADQQSTLFPSEVAGLKESERSVQSADDQAAYILYKRLAAHLHVPTASALQSRQSDIREAAEHFGLTFFPWANPIYADRDKDESLVDVLNHALDLSLWLFGQPYLYEWVWEEVGRRGTMVAPGLVRATDERGRVLDRPVVVVNAVIAAG